MSSLHPQSPGIPRPPVSELSQTFWDGCLHGELRYQRCQHCSTTVFDPARLCRGCGSDDLAWERSAGIGIVYSASTVYRPQDPAFTTPYAVAIIALEEGFHMISNIVECTTDEIRIGMPVEVLFHTLEDGFVLPYFRPRSDSNEAPSLRRTGG